MTCKMSFNDSWLKLFSSVGKMLLRQICPIILIPRGDRVESSAFFIQRKGESMGLSTSKVAASFLSFFLMRCPSFPHWLKYSEVTDVLAHPIYITPCMWPCMWPASYTLSRCGRIPDLTHEVNTASPEILREKSENPHLFWQSEQQL